MAIKSIAIRAEIDCAGKSHNCQANSLHRVKMGDVRLKIRNGRSWDHYCKECGEKIIQRGIDKLRALQPFTPTL